MTRDFLVVGRSWSITTPPRPERVAQLFEEHPAAFVRTDDAAEIRFPSQGQDVIEDVRGATKPQGFGVDMDDRNRGFRRDAAHTAPDIMVENEVADHEHGGLGKSRDILPKRLRRRRASPLWAPKPAAAWRVAFPIEWLFRTDPI